MNDWPANQDRLIVKFFFIFLNLKEIRDLFSIRPGVCFCIIMVASVRIFFFLVRFTWRYFCFIVSIFVSVSVFFSNLNGNNLFAIEQISWRSRLENFFFLQRLETEKTTTGYSIKIFDHHLNIHPSIFELMWKIISVESHHLIIWSRFSCFFTYFF